MNEFAVMPKADYLDACNAIREKTGSADLIKSGGMGAAIREIQAGGGEPGKPYIDTSKITDFSYYCYKGKRIYTLEGTDTSNGEVFDYMFDGITLLQPPELPKFIDTSNGKSFICMFRSCYNYTELPIINTENATTLSSLFNGCSSITQIESLDTRNCSDFSGLVNGCYYLEKIPPLDTSNGTSFNYMFYGCPKLESISLTTAKANFSGNSFQGCTALKNLTIGQGWAVSLYLNYSNNLTVDSLHGIIENLADMTGMTAPQFKIGTTNIAKIDAEHIAMLEAKNWSYS